MLFLIDEDLPCALGEIFSSRGYEVQQVRDISSLRGAPDEVIFAYAEAHHAIIVTGDLDFPNPERFPIHQLPGMILTRFPNEMPVAAICREVERLTKDLADAEWQQLLIIEPGFIRLRPLDAPLH